MAKYGTPSADNSLDVDRVSFASGQDADGASLYRRPQEHPSFWNSVFSAYAPTAPLAIVDPHPHRVQ